MDYFGLSDGTGTWDIEPATTADVLALSSGCVDDELRLGHLAVAPVLHPWLISDFASLCALPISTLDRLMFGGLGVVATSGAFTRLEERGALDVRTGPSGVRTLAQLWPLATCKERLDRLAAGETLDPFFRPMSDADRNQIVAAGLRTFAKLDALSRSPADLFLEAVPVAPRSLRPSDAWRGEHGRNAHAAIQTVLRREQRRARLPAGPLMVDQETMLQEAVFELFTAGAICMAGSAGLIDDDLAADFIEDELSETRDEENAGLAPKEAMLRSIFDEKPRVRRPGDLIVWARRAQASFQLLSHFFRASRGEPRDAWRALLRSAGLAID